jgi:hypothetical protein
MLNDTTGLQFIEGPERYSPNDVAAAFSAALEKPVSVASRPENEWLETLQNTGFSKPAAEYMVNMTKITLQDNYEVIDPERGGTTLNDYICKIT